MQAFRRSKSHGRKSAVKPNRALGPSIKPRPRMLAAAGGVASPNAQEERPQLAERRTPILDPRLDKNQPDKSRVAVAAESGLGARAAIRNANRPIRGSASAATNWEETGSPHRVPELPCPRSARSTPCDRPCTSRNHRSPRQRGSAIEPAPRPTTHLRPCSARLREVRMQNRCATLDRVPRQTRGQTAKMVVTLFENCKRYCRLVSDKISRPILALVRTQSFGCES